MRTARNFLYAALSALVVSVMVVAFSQCTLNQSAKSNVQRTYSMAQEVYLNAWDTYHTAFLAQSDEVKAKWTKEYHPLFLKAALALQAWNMNLSSATLAGDANQAVDQLTTILLSIKK